MSDIPVFDKSKPYGEIFGGGRARYAQGGHNFTLLGEYLPPGAATNHVPLKSSKERRAEKAAAKLERRASLKNAWLTPAEAPATDAPAEETPQEDTQAGDIGELHWTQLRKLVEDAGGEYVGKPEAIEFLKNLS